MILMLNCSYKGKNGNTQYFMESLRSEMKEEQVEICNITQVIKDGIQVLIKKLEDAEIFVIGAPLYVDGLPAQAVRILELLLANAGNRLFGKKVYVISNLGFYESEQIRHLFDIVRNWCERMQMIYGGGIAIGAGPMITALRGMPIKRGLNKDIGNGLEILAKAIQKQECIENYYAKTKIPRIVYIKAAHMTFRKALRENC